MSSILIEPDLVQDEVKTAIRTDRLKYWREHFGWSQRELARRCGMGEGQVSKYEAGNTDPSAKHVKAMAVVLGVSTDYLVGLSDNPRGDDSPVSDEERRLLMALREGDGPTALNLMSDLLRQRMEAKRPPRRKSKAAPPPSESE